MVRTFKQQRKLNKAKKLKLYKKRKFKTSKPFVKIVKRIIRRMEETKQQVWIFNRKPLTLQSSTASITDNYIVCNPSNATSGGYTVARGTGPNQMVGDKIFLVKCILKYTITMELYNATTNNQPRPVMVRMYFFRQKRTPNNDPQTINVCGAGVNANFFELGSSNIGFSGLLDDYNLKMDNDLYTYLGSMTHKVGPATPQNGGNAGSPYYVGVNNDYKYSIIRTRNITSMMPKIMNQDDDGIWCNPYLICLFQVVSGDGQLIANNQK